ncbi:MAG: hypothetical protein K2N99_02940, partial [Malacoplasma sp.]|nr:hypothetical protein [Malacoplasma sp.]
MKEVEFKEGEVIWVKQENPERSDFQKRDNPFKPKEFVKTIYTDGGSKIIDTIDRKRYIGAWSFYDQNTGEIRGESQDNATNNQMEMMAVIKAIEYCNELGVPKDKFIQIILDSDYVRLGTIFWSKKWERNGWTKT